MTELSGATGIPGPELVITRVFDAPRDLLFGFWINPEHIAKWWGPRGCTTPQSTVAMDVSPGGSWRIRMISDDGTEHWTRGVYHEIDEPERLVFTFAWEEADGTLGNETLVTVVFAAHGDKTEMTFHQTGFVSLEDRDGHGRGWSSCFDRLGEYALSQHGCSRPATGAERRDLREPRRV